MKFKPMTHQEAVNRCYELTPQLREYDEFMYLGVRWLPYTMFFHHRNYTSDIINTDDMGFRLSYSPFGWASTANFPADKPVNIVIGGSTAMGTGTTSDASTVSSTLARLTGEVWLNFGGRGYNSVQEAIIFMLNQSRFGQINNIVILSGMNTLTLEGLPDDYTSEYGKYYYSFEFSHYMNRYNEDLKKRASSYASWNDASSKKLIPRLAEKLNNWLDEADENPADKVFTDTHMNLAERVTRAAKSTVGSAAQINHLAQRNGARIHYVLQPLSRWSKEVFHESEEEMFYAIDACANNFWRLFEKLVTPDLHATYSSQIQQGCLKEDIRFFDMNMLMKDSPVLHENIYIDHLHFNDLGYEEMGRIIYEKVL
ncbi:TPA: SGNH/GDSL hydrolase family protein [Serratia marcescens]|uniref:G-D-S-L family lipolytic protein n=1 Tax=Serratia marcescens TaxID=615 RepID=A0AB33FV39_SERMA|nr:MULTISPECIES: G-D-S-L family lipolytic protein [Serratia]AKL41522.1 G-D-S-L family lipolytic protein [Serratia marcescens]AWL68798.1 G-D-S-L family lipolytic protein [Serratia marcescens]UBI66595.1 SGNH/GDSL hydrolase family protein [Serratia sp. HRI]HAT2213473.1 SGNH/GDSL hydrolase family protein [Serratia marcescens]HAT2224741.1 SGNH/GDSL hydrolase family protein [Serratia marcescens]